MPASQGRVGYKQTANSQPTVLTQRPIGGRINSANTNVNQLIKSGTNTGTRTTTTFELTGIDTTNSVDYTDWILEINQAGNVQSGVIQSNTFANPGVATMASAFELAFPGSGNLTYLLYPDVVNPIGIQLHPLAQGTLTIYRGPVADVEMEIGFLLPSDVHELAVHDMRNIYYQFSIGTGAPEILRWGDAVKPASGNLSTSLATSTDTTPTQITKTIAAIATPEALAANGTFFRQAILIGKKAARTSNVGIVYLGIGVTNDTQAFEISPNQMININAPPGEKYDLNDWGLDVLNAGDGVIIIYS